MPNSYTDYMELFRKDAQAFLTLYIYSLVPKHYSDYSSLRQHWHLVKQTLKSGNDLMTMHL